MVECQVPKKRVTAHAGLAKEAISPNKGCSSAEKGNARRMAGAGQRKYGEQDMLTLELRTLDASKKDRLEDGDVSVIRALVSRCGFGGSRPPEKPRRLILPAFASPFRRLLLN